MKNLIFINGTAGVGKTSTSKALLKLLPNCVMLDGDWCWYSDPWTITDETKAMVLDNMGVLLNNFLDCSAYDNVVFCWVMHEEWILEKVLARLADAEYTLHKFSLICSEEALTARLQRDIDSGELDIGSHFIKVSKSRLPNFQTMNTIKIDTSHITVTQCAEEIYRQINAIRGDI